MFFACVNEPWTNVLWIASRSGVPLDVEALQLSASSTITENVLDRDSIIASIGDLSVTPRVIRHLSLFLKSPDADITPAVEALREQFGYPGMSILQFAFGTDAEADKFRPHNFPRSRVVYTGTHDNDTTVGWWESSGQGDSTRASEEVAREKAFALQYLGADGREMNWTLIRAALASVANTVIVPLQDVLGLGSDARMNLPGRASGNWRFRFSWDQLTPDVVHRLRTMVDTYDR